MNPVRYSRLRLMGRSPAHYLSAVEEETIAMERGSAIDRMLLEDRPVLAYPGKVRRGKEYEAFKAEHPTATILTAKECENVQGMAASVRTNPEAMRLLSGRRQFELDWTYLGRACQSHIDVLGDGGAFVTELKSTRDAKPSRLAWQAQKLAYYAQLAFYRRAVIESGLGRPDHAYVVAVESSRPWPVTVGRLTERALDLGERVFRTWFEQLLVCEQSNRWPAYSEAVVPLDVPDDFELEIGDETVSVPFESAEVPF